jgi:phage protein D
VDKRDFYPCAMITQARAARPAITMQGKDYYQSLAPYFLSLEYSDNCDGKKADDLHIKLADRDRRFINDWMPKKGAFLDVSIIVERWFAPYASGLSLDCGRFWIDSVDYSLPDHTVSVKGTSIPTGVRLKASTATRGWEKANLKDIASQIATESKMSVDYQSDVNPRYLRTEQHEESPLAFLKKRANNAKLAIKVHRNKIVIFDEQKLEAAAPKFALLYGDTAPQAGMAAYRMTGGSFTTKVNDTASKTKVSHTEVESGNVKSGEWKTEGDSGSGSGSSDDDEGGDHQSNEDGDDDEGASTEAQGRELAGDWNTGDSAGATTMAKAKARDKNKKKDQAKVELSIGNPLIAAGMTFNLVGVGQFDGKWFIESAQHSVGPEYKTSLGIRRCLQGY